MKNMKKIMAVTLVASTVVCGSAMANYKFTNKMSLDSTTYYWNTCLVAPGGNPPQGVDPVTGKVDFGKTVLFNLVSGADNTSLTCSVYQDASTNIGSFRVQITTTGKITIHTDYCATSYEHPDDCTYSFDETTHAITINMKK